MNIKALRDQRAAKATEARNLLDTNTTTWSKEVSAQIDAIYAEIDLIDDQIARAEKQAKIDGDQVNDDTGREVSARILNGMTPEQREAATAYSAAFKSFLMHGERGVSAEEATILRSGRPQNAQSVGTGSAGGYLVPTGFGAELIEALKYFGGMRKVSTTIKTSMGNAIPWPTVDETAQEGEMVAENVAATSQDATFGTVSIGSWKFSSKIFTVPFELLMDQGPGIDIEAYIRRAAATRIARINNRLFTLGAGTTEPKGAVTAAASGKVGTTGQTVSVIYDDLIDLIHSVDPAYRMGMSDSAGEGDDTSKVGFMFHDTTLRNLKKLKDGQGRPLWLPSVAQGEPDRFLDYGYTINQHMPVMAANAKSILFGDFSQYLIRDIMEVTLFRFDDSAYVSKGQIGFLAWSRADGNLISAGQPIKYYQNSAT